MTTMGLKYYTHHPLLLRQSTLHYNDVCPLSLKHLKHNREKMVTSIFVNCRQDQSGIEKSSHKKKSVSD